MTVTVVLADDQALVRRGFRLILETEPDIEVVAEAEDGQQAIDAVRWHRPAVVLMDIQMPGLDGLEATRRILADADSHTRVLILTTFERDDYVFEALQLGASGFLLTTAPPEDLITAVGEILASRPAFVLDAEPAGTTLKVTTVSLSRLDVYVDDRPVGSLDVTDGDHTVQLPSNGASARRVDLRGFSNGELAAARRLEV